METLYFNQHEFIKALDLCSTDPELALERFSEYVVKYPEDVEGMSHYVSTLVINKKLDDAEVELAKLEEKMRTNAGIIKYLENNPKAIANIIFCKVKLRMYQKKYQESYDLIMDNYPLLKKSNINLDSAAIFCRKQLGYLGDFLVKDTEYLYGQMVNYSDERFLDHTKKHLTIDGVEPDETVTSKFIADFPIDKVFAELKRIIPSNLQIYYGVFEDMYIYKFDSCGKVQNRMTDYFKVVAFHDANQFITMCPCLEGEYFDHYDLNYLKEEKPKLKQNRGIDRFNKRYGKKLDN